MTLPSRSSLLALATCGWLVAACDCGAGLADAGSTGGAGGGAAGGSGGGAPGGGAGGGAGAAQDAGLADAGAPDGGTPDAGEADAGLPDGGADGGLLSDGGLRFDPRRCRSIDCPVGEVCCNFSCNVCAPPGQGCHKVHCLCGIGSPCRNGAEACLDGNCCDASRGCPTGFTCDRGECR